MVNHFELMPKVRVKIWDRFKKQNLKNNFLSLDSNMLTPICQPCLQCPSKTKTYFKVTVLTVVPSVWFPCHQTWMNIEHWLISQVTWLHYLHMSIIIIDIHVYFPDHVSVSFLIQKITHKSHACSLSSLQWAIVIFLLPSNYIILEFYGQKMTFTKK